MLYDPHLDLFLQVAELGSFSKAAEAGYITPSAVIKQINLLEDDLGVRLFERTHRGLKLTKAGESLKKDAPELIRMSREAASRAISSMKSDGHIIRIGTSPMTPAEVLVELWPKLSEILPGLKFQLVPFDNTPENARMILKNLGENIDVVAGLFDDDLLKYRECNGIELTRDKLCVAFSVNHPLAQKKRLSVKDLYGQELMMLTPGSMGSMDALREYLTVEHPQVKIVDFPLYNTGVFNECENGGRLLVTTERWKTVHPLLKTVRMGWKYDMSNNNKTSRYRNLFKSHDSQLIWKPDQALPYVMHFENGQNKSLFIQPETKKKLVIWPEIIRTKSANIEQTEDNLWFSTVKESFLKGHLLAFDSSEAVFEFKQGDTTLIVRVSVMSDEEFLAIRERYKNQGKIPPINKEHLVQLIAWDEWVVGQSRLLPREVYYVETDNNTAGSVGINVRITVCFDNLGKNKKWMVEWWDPSHEHCMLANEIEYDNGVFLFTRDQSEGGGHYRFSVMELDTYNEIVRKTLLSAPLLSDVEEMNRAFFEADYD